MNNTPIKTNLEEYERLFLSLGDKTRLKLLALMADEPVSVGYLVDELGDSQPKVSRHLAYLRNSGVVNTRRDGKNIYYGIQESTDPDIDRVIKFVVGTMSGESYVESPVILRSPQRKSEEADPAINAKRSKAEMIISRDEQDQHAEPESELVDHPYQEESEVGEVLVESETDEGELEVFLL